MIRCSPSRSLVLPKGHESSPLRSPRDSDNALKLWQKMNQSVRQVEGIVNVVNQVSKDVEKKRRQILGAMGGTAGWDWMYPDHKELDTAYGYDAGKFVYISPLNTLVTTGLTDIVSNTLVQSCEGLWQANRDIPPISGGKFNVPVFPYPTGMGVSAPTGAPLKGDLDALDASGQPAIYWLYWGQVAC